MPSDDSGKREPVKIEDGPKPGTLTVWANPGLVRTIGNVDGVAYVSNYLRATRYDVEVDGRYDINKVKQNIRAAIDDAY